MNFIDLLKNQDLFVLVIFYFFFGWDQTILLRGFRGRLKSWEDNDIQHPSLSHLPSSSAAERLIFYFLSKFYFIGLCLFSSIYFDFNLYF